MHLMDSLNRILREWIFSQPPLLSAMVRAIYRSTHDINLVGKAVPVLLKEHEFWNSGNKAFPTGAASFNSTSFNFTFLNCAGVHRIVVQDAQAESYYLSRYYAMWDKPRPESSTIVSFWSLQVSHNNCVTVAVQNVRVDTTLLPLTG